MSNRQSDVNAPVFDAKGEPLGPEYRAVLYAGPSPETLEFTVGPDVVLDDGPIQPAMASFHFVEKVCRKGARHSCRFNSRQHDRSRNFPETPIVLTVMRHKCRAPLRYLCRFNSRQLPAFGP
jgi:hypothetical protein